MTVPQAAKAIGVHFATVYRWIEAGTVLTDTIGGILFVSKSEIEKLKNERARSSVG
jgi:excisionase family DNA binding protein